LTAVTPAGCPTTPPQVMVEYPIFIDLPFSGVTPLPCGTHA
jgi:hypothetical protein